MQVVEPIAILQRFKLCFEDEVEGRAEHAAEWHFLFGQAADPKIDCVDACRRDAGRRADVRALAVQEVETIYVVRNENSLIELTFVDDC